MEFKEFRNPLEKDYDIKSSLGSSYPTGSRNGAPVSNYNPISNNNKKEEEEKKYYQDQLIDIMNSIGYYGVITEEGLQEQLGIGLSEYLHPTAETIEKVNQKINSRHK